MFIQQAHDQEGLREYNGGDQKNLPTILIPYRRTTKQDFAARRQTAFANAPALHFPPVKYWACKLDWCCPDFARLLSAKDTNGNGSRLSAGIGHQKKRAAYDRASEEGFVIRKNRRIGDGMKSC